MKNVKTILFLFFVGISLSGYAQKFQLTNSEGVPFSDGQKIAETITENDLDRDGDFIINIFVENLLDIELNVHTLRTNLALIEGMSAFVCFWTCYEPDEFEIDHEMMERSSEAYQLKIKPDACYCYFGISQIKLEFWTEENESDKMTLFVDIDMQPLSVKESSNSDPSLSAYPNPAARNSIINVSYTLSDNSHNNYLVIKNVMGAYVIRFPLNPYNTQISFDATGLKSGVYFYAIESNNRLSVAKKLIIK
jgi:hypothetical protein